MKSDFTGTTPEKKNKTIASIVADKTNFITASVEVEHFSTVTRNKNDTTVVTVRKQYVTTITAENCLLL